MVIWNSDTNEKKKYIPTNHCFYYPCNICLLVKLGENIISVIRNYDPIGNGSLGEYLDYADSKNEIKSTSGKKELVINGYQAASRNEVRGGINKKAYYIYVSDVDKIVYVFSTKSESLYSDLDQIAQSFRYTP